MSSRVSPLRVLLHSSADVAHARRAAQRLLIEAGLRPVRVTRFATAVSEIARNTVGHGGGGEAIFAFETIDGRKCLTVRFDDAGAGIADIVQAMADGFSTARSLGKGLGGAKRLSDAFEIRSTPGRGTTVKLACRLT